MKAYNRLLMAALAALVATGAAAQKTQKLSAGKSNDFGLVYNLPLTSVKVVVEAERSVKKPGEFYRYSRKYLNLDPITEQSETWTLKSVVVFAEGVPDTEESYLVQFKSGSTPFMTVDRNSFPISLNDDGYQLPELPALPKARAAEPTILETPAAAHAMTQEMIQSQSSAKRAEVGANKIYELRQSRNDIISGQADQMPSDGQAMKIALDNIAVQESALTAMFTGTDQRSTEVGAYNWLFDIPEEDESTRVVIARLSQTGGLVDADDLSGEPIYLDVKVTSRGELPANDKGDAKSFPKGGLAYRIPGEASVAVVYEGRTIARTTLKVAQLGYVFGLDPAMFSDKKAPAYVHFDPTTGEVIEIGTAN